jgi:hypothetical protein
MQWSNSLELIIPPNYNNILSQKYTIYKIFIEDVPFVAIQYINLIFMKGQDYLYICLRDSLFLNVSPSRFIYNLLIF